MEAGGIEPPSKVGASEVPTSVVCLCSRPGKRRQTGSPGTSLVVFHSARLRRWRTEPAGFVVALWEPTRSAPKDGYVLFTQRARIDSHLLGCRFLARPTAPRLATCGPTGSVESVRPQVLRCYFT